MSKRTMSDGAPMIGADETIVKVSGKAKVVGFVADAENDEPLGDRHAGRVLRRKSSLIG